MTTSFLPPGRRPAARRETAAPTTPRAPTTSAQRVILALGVPVVLTIAAWSGYGIVAALGRSAYTTTASVPASGRQLTLTESGAGGGGAGITVAGGAAAGTVQVSGTVRYDLIRPDIRPTVTSSHGAAGTSVGFSCPADDCSAGATASVPSATAVSVTASDGDNVTVSGITAPVSADTGGGNVTLNAVTGPLNLITEGGSVQGTALSAPDASVNTDPGSPDGGGSVDLTLTTVPKDLQVNSSGGNVTLQLPPSAAGYRLQLDGGCGPGGQSGPQSATPSSASSGVTDAWCGDVSNSVPDNPSSPNVIVVSSGGGQITVT